MQSTSPVVISAILLCFLAVAVRDGLTQEPLIPFERNEMWGYKTSSGEVMIQPQFEIAEDFTAEGIAAIADAKGWAYINRKGNILVRSVKVGIPFTQVISIGCGSARFSLEPGEPFDRKLQDQQPQLAAPVGRRACLDSWTSDD
jgi:hypothetical protein